MTTNILWFDELGMGDVAQVGGKNASLGEMVSKLEPLGVRVPGGFATTADAYHDFLAADGLYDRILGLVMPLDVTDVAELARVGSTIRDWIEQQPFPAGLEASIREAYQRLIDDDPAPDEVSWAVRSSATAEDLPDASFAGQQETYLNISGIDNLLQAIRSVSGVLVDPAPDVLVWDLAGSSKNLRLRWCTRPHLSDVIAIRDQVMRDAAEALAEAGVDLPFPTQVVLFHDQTEETDGDRRRQREGWPAGDSPPAPRPVSRVELIPPREDHGSGDKR